MRRVLLLVAVLAAIAAAGQAVRRGLGVEIGAESFQAWMQGFGWRAPLVFLALLGFRHFLLLPSTLLLTVGGLCFGTLVGGLLGAAGLTLTGAAEFALLRTVRPAALVRWARSEGSRFARAVGRGAPLAVALSTAVPPAPMTAFHGAAAFTAMSFGAFLAAAGAGAAVRSFALAYFGAGLLAAEPARLLAGAGVLVLLVVLPLLHPRIRERLVSPARARAAVRSGAGAPSGTRR